MRVAVADDVMLIRSGLAWLLRNADIEVVGEAPDAEQLQRLVALERPDVAIVDIKMPPTMTDEGLVAARAIRRSYPQTAVILLSQYVELDYGSPPASSGSTRPRPQPSPLSPQALSQ